MINFVNLCTLFFLEWKLVFDALHDVTTLSVSEENTHVTSRFIFF